MDAQALSSAGATLILVGIIIIFLAFIMMALSSKGGKVRGGGVVMIGPIPIVFGTDKESVRTLFMLAIVLMIATFLLFIVVPRYVV